MSPHQVGQNQATKRSRECHATNKLTRFRSCWYLNCTGRLPSEILWIICIVISTVAAYSSVKKHKKNWTITHFFKSPTDAEVPQGCLEPSALILLNDLCVEFSSSRTQNNDTCHVFFQILVTHSLHHDYFPQFFETFSYFSTTTKVSSAMALDFVSLPVVCLDSTPQIFSMGFISRIKECYGSVAVFISKDHALQYRAVCTAALFCINMKYCFLRPCRM